MDPLLSIGSFARRSRLSGKALRLYERLGLLTPVQVESNGYRRYQASQLATARLISMLRRLDMPLAQVAEVLVAAGANAAEISMLRQSDGLPYAIGDNESTASRRAVALAARREAADLVAAYWRGIEERVAAQRTLALHIQTRLLGEEGSSLHMQTYTIQQRDVPEQLVLTEQRHATADELPRWIPTAFGRLLPIADRLGGVTGASLVIFHGEVNQESDGPVEVCLPIAPPQGPQADAPMRREPAHREAYVRITKAQVQYPQILSAFDAVAEWVAEHGLNVTGAPREIYFADFMSAAPSDEVCDVAYPVG